MTSFRKLYKNDDISLIANGIYFNERTVFDTIFNGKQEAVEVIKKLITSEYVNEYHGFFITVIYDESPEQIEGFVITYKKDQIPRNSAINAYADSNEISLPMILLNSIMGRFRYKLTKDDYIIKNLYVLEDYRNKGHATKLIKKSIQKARQYNARKVILDVEEGNSYLMDLFIKLGFEENNERMGPLMEKLRGYNRLKFELN